LRALREGDLLEAAGADLIVSPIRIGAFEIIRDDETLFLKIESGTFLKDDEVRGMCEE